MEIVVFLAMMIVPFLAIAALILAILNNKRVNALKAVTLRYLRTNPVNANPRKQAIDEFEVEDI